MTTKEYELIAESIWRSGYIKDKNKVRQNAKEQMRRLISNDLAASFSNKDKNFNEDEFLKSCDIKTY